MYWGGLYYYNTTNMENNSNNNQVTDYYSLKKVHNKKAYLHIYKTEGANEARILKQLVG